MGANVVKPIYFFHIPKTGGRFLYSNTAHLLRYDLIKNDISLKKYLNCFGHISFKPIDTVDMISMTILREPVARTISHYLFIYQNALSGTDLDYDKKRFFDFLEANPERGFINYQTKFISYNGDDREIEIFDKNLPKSINDEDFKRAKERLENIDYLIDMKSLNFDLTNNILNRMYENFNLTNPYGRVEVFYDTIISKDSSKLFNAMTDNEKKKIESFMPYDVELYKTTKFNY